MLINKLMMNNEVKELIQAVETADSSEGLLEAVKALAAARQEAAIPTLISVLGYNNPGAAVAAVDGLIELGEAVVPRLLEKVDGYNYGARAWATRVFAGIGDPSALDLLLEAASSDFSMSVRRAAAKGLGNIQWAKLADTEVPATQAQVLKTLLLVSQDPEWIVRYGAVVGLASLALAVGERQLDFVRLIWERLQEILESDQELAVRARTKLALQELQAVVSL
jgi:phycocyanobilin lyase beta subunit